MFKSYEIDKSKIDRPNFFRSLAKYFPDATSLYVGGDNIAEDVMACYEAHQVREGWNLADSRVWTYKCFFSQELMDKLAALSENHDFLQLLERLSLYKENKRLLQWYNVLHDAMIWVSDLVPEETLLNLAQELSLKYTKQTVGDLCACILLQDSAVVLMGANKLSEEVSDTLEEVKSRGEPYEWVSAQRCRQCGQWWLAAEEIGHIDILCLRRLTPEATDRLLKEDIWPSDFNKYATLLRLGKEAGRVGGWIEGIFDPSLSSIPLTIARLAKETPGIHVSELAELLNLDVAVAVKFAEQVGKEKGVIITFDKTHTERD